MTNEMKDCLEAINESYKQGYKDAIDKACEWLRTRVFTYESDFFEDFKKAMEDESK